MKLFTILTFIFVFTQIICSQENMPSKLGNQRMSWAVGLSEEDRLKMESLWKEIGEDLKDDKNPFAGTYGKTGYGSGYFLRWSVNKGFILIPYFDQNLIVDFSYGKVEITKDSEIILIPQKEMQGNGRELKITPRIWIPVKNGEFIIPKDQIAFFGNYYGGFGEFNGFPRKRNCDECGTFARRMSDNQMNVENTFIAPPNYLKFIKQPIEAQITYIGKKRISFDVTASCCGFEEKSSALSVKINAGRKQGVTRGLLFLLVDDGDDFSQVLKVTRVGEKTSEAIIFRVLDKNGKETYDGEEYDSKSESYNKIPFPPIRIGTKVTTSPIVQ